jgi:cytochrome P450
LNLLGDVRLQTSSPENIKTICTSAFQDFGVEPQRADLCAPFLGRGIFTTDGQSWKNARSFIKPVFAKSEVSDLDHFEKHVERFLNLIPSDGTTFDVLPLAKRLVNPPRYTQLLNTDLYQIYG